MAAGPTRTCFIHIGPHKTGTTSIQRFLTDNADRLETHGFLFPVLNDESKSASTHSVLLARGLKPDGTIRRRDEGWIRVEAALKRGDKNLILSHEAFATRIVKPATLGNVIQFFEQYDYRIHVIAYVRSQPDWLNSWYVQQQKRFYAKNTFMEFADRLFETGRIDPLRYLGGLMDNPKIDLEVVSFDKAVKVGLELDFCRRVGVDADQSWKFPDRINSNVGAKTIYVAQRVMENSEIVSPKSKLHGKMKAALREARSRNKWQEQPFMALDDALARTIAERYEASNREFLTRFPIGTYEEVFPSRTYAKQVVDPTTVSASEQQKLDGVVQDILKLIENPSEREKSPRAKGGRKKRRAGGAKGSPA